MELTRINVDFKDIRPNQQIQNISADVVLVDSTTENVQPMLYILKQDKFFSEQDFEAIIQGFLSFDRDAFVQAGEVASINKKNKQIILSNQNTVTYNHLIVARGTQTALLSYEFLAGVQTLVDALRVRKKLPSSLETASNNNFQTKKTKRRASKQQLDQSQPPQKVEKIHPVKLLSSMAAKSNLNRKNKRLYEVQL